MKENGLVNPVEPIFVDIVVSEKLIPSRARLTACRDITATTTSTDGTTTQTIKLTPYTQFASVYRACKYIASVGEYDIKHYEVPYDYGFKETFESLEEYNTVANSCVKYRPEWDTRFGNPRPSLKTYIWESNPDWRFVHYIRMMKDTTQPHIQY